MAEASLEQMQAHRLHLVEVLGLCLAGAFALLLGVLLLGVIYLAINQSFLTQIVLFERAGSRTAIQRGRALVRAGVS